MHTLSRRRANRAAAPMPAADGFAEHLSLMGFPNRRGYGMDVRVVPYPVILLFPLRIDYPGLSTVKPRITIRF